MSQPTMTTGNAAPALEQADEQSVMLLAVREGLRLQKSRRLNDRTFGPTLYWLFESSTRRLLTSKSGWSLNDVKDYLSS